MKQFLVSNIAKIRRTKKTILAIYLLLYVLWGIGMNAFGSYAEIAKFTYWWQIITCYVCYMIPISILLKDYDFFTQYAYGLVAMGILEFLGYALKTSYAYPNNILDQLFQPQNFSLGMALFFALYFPVGNLAVHWLHKKIFNSKKI